MNKDNADSELLRRFVETFNRFDDLFYTHANPPADAFDAGIDPHDWNQIHWKPACWSTPPEAISAIRVAGPLPTLYEKLVLSYRWPKVNLRLLDLLPNELADDLQPLAGAMFADPVLNHTLLPAGFVRFAMAADNYDPICFGLNQLAGGD